MLGRTKNIASIQCSKIMGRSKNETALISNSMVRSSSISPITPPKVVTNGQLEGTGKALTLMEAIRIVRRNRPNLAQIMVGGCFRMVWIPQMDSTSDGVIPTRPMDCIRISAKKAPIDPIKFCGSPGAALLNEGSLGAYDIRAISISMLIERRHRPMISQVLRFRNR